MPAVYSVVTSSNKDIHIPAKRVAYPIDMKNKVFVLNPIIDKISITSNIEDAKVAQVVTHWIAMSNQEGWLPLEPKHAGGTGYAKAAFLNLPQAGPKVLIQVGRKKNPGAIRFEFNPSQFSQQDVVKMDGDLMGLSEGAFGLAWILKTGKITRADIAVDILGEKFNALLIELPSSPKIRMHIDDKGGLQTVTSLLGKGFKSMAYNKRAHTQEKKIESEFADYPRCRVEWTIGRTKKKFSTLGEIKCPWGSVSIIRPPLAPPVDVEGHVWKLFLDVCRFRGREYAFSLLSSPLRKEFEVAIDDPSNKIWRPKELWMKVPEWLKGSAFFKYC